MPGYKSLGTKVSQNPQNTGTGGQFSGEDKAYESIIIQKGSPVIDWEMNLNGDINNDYGLRSGNQKLYQSCFLNGDFLEHSDLSGSLIFPPATAGNENKFELLAQNTIINGWNINIEYTSTNISGINDIQLGVPPTTGSRIDLVIVEVWRALILAAPDTSNKSSTGLIVRNGNIKAPDSVNLVDDLIDPTYGVESNARVQIQYRLRVIENINIDSYPDGLTDPTVFANTVSNFGSVGADGSVTNFNFVQMANDGGLWRAGTGDSAGAIAIGSVDGYMYAIPVLAVARRNSTVFNKDTNLNGGSIISTGVSDRPDGLFSDQIIDSDVLDLRRGRAADFREILSKMTKQIFDNALSTQLEQLTSGPSGTSFLDSDNIGTGTSFGLSDGIRTHFSDRAITESIVVKSNIASGISSVDFDLSSLLLAWDTVPRNVLTSGLSDTTIIGFGKIRIVQQSLFKNEDMLDLASSIHITSSEFKINVGVDIDQLHLDFNTSTTTSTTIYVELYISYSSGHGTSRNLLDSYELWIRGSLPTWVDTSFLSATVDTTRTNLSNSLWNIDQSHRELSVHFQSITQSSVTFYTHATNYLLIWEKLNGDPITINDGTNPSYTTTNYTSNTAYTLVSLTGATAITAGTVVVVSYVAFRAIPEIAVSPNDSYNLFYKTSAIQSIKPPAGTQTLDIIPREISEQIFIIGASTGSPDISFPYRSPGEQIPVAALPTPDFPESRINGPADISIIGFGSNVGFLQLPVYVPYSPEPSKVSLYRDGLDAVTDAEGRHFWPKSDSGTPSVYSPVVFGPELSSSRVHKTILPMLAELKSDFLSIGRKGTLIVVLLTNWIVFDSSNNVILTPTAGTSGASIFRVKGNMMNTRRVDP